MSRTIDDLGWEIERRWSELGDPPADDGMRTLDLPQTINGTPVYLAIATDGARLLLPFARDEHRSFRANVQSRGIRLQVRQLELDDQMRWFLDVVCTRWELRWLFSSFVADILLRIRRTPQANPVAIAQACFTAWRALFGAAERRLTVKQLAGLFGELHILDHLLERSPAAISAWRGPLREPHDFAAGEEHVEVKTTLSSEDDVVHIHGLQQLDAPEDGRLHLVHIRVEVPSEEGITVPALVDRLRTKDSSGRLLTLLQTAGYHSAHRDSYAELTFAARAENWYAVEGSFPRLTADTFAEGVPPALAEFGYMLDLALAGAPPIRDQQTSAILDALAE